MRIRPAAMTLVHWNGQQILFEPLGNDEAKRALLRGALGRRFKAREARLNRRGKR